MTTLGYVLVEHQPAGDYVHSDLFDDEHQARDTAQRQTTDAENAGLPLMFTAAAVIELEDQ